MSYLNPNVLSKLTQCSVGCFLGAIATAVFGERIGRRKSVAIGASISIIGAILQATAFGRAHLIVGRIVSGFGLGIINSTVPVMQAEFSPKASRGIFVCAQLSTLNFGIFLVYWIDYAFVSHTSSYAWRVPTILQCTILIPILGILTIIPETPRWLASHDRPEECLKVLAQVADMPEDDYTVQRLHTTITQTVAYEQSRQAGWKDIVRSDPIKSRRRFLIACGIQMFQQLGGINAIICRSCAEGLNSIADELNQITQERFSRRALVSIHIWLH